MSRLNGNNLQQTLQDIQLRVQVALGRKLTHGELAELANVGSRSLGDWMRGITAPPGMSAVFELLSRLPEADVMSVLEKWKDRAANQRRSEVASGRGNSRHAKTSEGKKSRTTGKKINEKD